MWLQASWRCANLLPQAYTPCEVAPELPRIAALKPNPCASLQVRAKQEESDRQGAEVARLHATTPEQLYHADLDAFEAALDERDEEDTREAELLVTQRGRAGRAGSGKAGVLAGCTVSDQA